MKRIWQPSNIYPTAKIGENVSIGAFSEIGENVVIGNNVRIGAFCFIPDGVTIENNVFIGPRVTFTNDKFPPSKKSMWGKILVENGASLGAGVIVLPDIVIGKNSVIGAGSVVTKSIPEGEVWFGVPARKK